MSMKAIVASMGIGAAAGAVAVLMMPRSNPTRQLAAKAAGKVEDAAMKIGGKLNETLDSM
ncbi:MAG: hypothetical protein IJZ39_02240 [Oscillospiraceae bacterium]|nr:hypothetical protein [Oscillospiraceae bacterium]